MDRVGLKAANMIMDEVKKVIVGKDEIIRKTLLCILAKGHILIEDIPGVGKTTMALAFSKAMALKQKRIQFTPDVMPLDVTGFNIYNKETQKFEFKEGAAMCNLLLADEINRTSSKTQSALLEAMEEQQVSVDGRVYPLPEPFIVIATQNPVGSIGTQMLPESQLDRFAMCLFMGYPQIEDEVMMLKGKHLKNPMDAVEPIINEKGLLYMQREAAQVFVKDNVYAYVAEIAAATRRHPDILLGLSPRGSVAICNLAKANAYLAGREFVTPDDVRSILFDAVAHRLILRGGVQDKRQQIKHILFDIIRDVPVRKEV